MNTNQYTNPANIIEFPTSAPVYEVRTSVDTSTGQPLVWVIPTDDDTQANTLTINEIDALISQLQQARDEAADYLTPCGYWPA